jgi:hypothetical membrane protein
MPSGSDSVRAGALAWILALQFFIAQPVVATAWPRPFSLSTGYISDLGNTTCDPQPILSTASICSPWHAVMNASFVTIGVTMALGALLTRSAFRRGWSRELAIVLFVLAGAGVGLVGAYPENEDDARHVLGAGINFICGNAALVLFGVSFESPARISGVKVFSVTAGLLGAAGVVLFVTDAYLGLGPGGMERVAAYPMAVWQIVAGLALMRPGARASASAL